MTHKKKQEYTWQMSLKQIVRLRRQYDVTRFIQHKEKAIYTHRNTVRANKGCGNRWVTTGQDN